MRYARCALLLAAAAACSACFQFSTVLTLKADGSGTIEQRLLFSRAAIAQLRQFAALSGGAPDFDPLSERQARDAAASLGPGVTYVSSTPVDSSDGVGRNISYAFTDVNQLSLDQAPSGPGGMPASPQGAGSGERVTFRLMRQADGRSLLTIALPAIPALSASSGPSAEQVAMVKPMLTGARLSIEIEPAGTLLRTSSPFVTGRRVTLLDVNADALFQDDTLLQRLQAAATPDEMKAILQKVPGIKLNLDPEMTIEFE
jgi:hypothetical protein